MIEKWKYRRGSGQGVVEFALVLPILLLLLLGLAEFARIFAIYTNLFNAAREGTRYGMVNAADTTGILLAAQSKIAFVDPSKVSTTISYDSGPGTVAKNPPNLLVGDRVIVSVHYDIEPMLPFLAPLLSNLSVDTEAARTISKVAAGAIPGPGASVPTATPTATSTATATPTATPTSTATGVPTATPTSTATATPTATPTPSPTPTLIPPNLIVERITLVNTSPISTYIPLTFTVSIANVGQTAVNARFWTDLFVDPTSPISPTNPPMIDSADWAAINSLAAGASITVTLRLSTGVDATGVHTSFVVADSLDDVIEDNELDNMGSPLTFTVSIQQPPPTPTPAPVGGGAISGSTWLDSNGGIAPQGRVNVYWYRDNVLVAQTMSDQDGNYLLPDLPPGTYTVIGEAVINDVLYTDIAWGINVNSGETTPYVTLYLQ